LGADDHALAQSGDVLEPAHFDAKQHLEEEAAEIAQPFTAHVRSTSTVATRLATPSSVNSKELLTPTDCNRATIALEPTMKAAEITLTTAMTRARFSGAAQLCTAANDGTDEQSAADRDAGEFEQDEEPFRGRREGEPFDVPGP